MNSELLRIFEGQTLRLFAFLSSDYGFSAPQLEVDGSIPVATVTYRGQQVAVQLVLDERDDDIDCRIAIVTNGVVTKYFARDEGGALVREPLYAMLTRKGARGSAFTRVSGLPLEKRIPITLADFARMLRTEGRDILADSSSVFS
jgi:hypothetical protein